MWTTDQLGQAVWQTGGSSWAVEARGGNHGFGIVAATDVDSAFSSPGRYLSLGAVRQPLLPKAAEQYVRGQRWQINYPQDDSTYALRVALEPIESQQDFLVIEVTVSIQTDLLDSHPQLDVDVPCFDIDSFVPNDPWGDDEVQGTGSAPISVAKQDSCWSAVLLGPHDRPFTTNHSTDSLLRLRLFGEFLEKGVIRKARPWIVIDRTGRPPDEDQLTSLWKRLCESPLPLTP